MRLTRWTRGNRKRRAGFGRQPAGLAALLTAFALCCIWGAAPARAEDRTISFKQVHTGETLTVTYKRNGRYDPAAMAKINYILRDWRRNESTRMDPLLIDTLWEAHRRTGSRQPIHVLSGYRSPVTNAMLRSRSSGVAQTSQHMLGKATDFFFPDIPLANVRAIGLQLENGGVGYYPKSGSPFVHLDVGGVRHWPRMTRQQLVKLFPSGDTVHIPSDGKPLARYELAKARIERKQGGQPSIALASVGGSAGADSDPARLTGRSDGRSGQRTTLLSALFGNSRDEEEETTATAPQQMVVAAPQQSLTLASAVPLPSRRPEDIAAARSAPEQALALAAVAPPVPATRPDAAGAAAPAGNDLIAQILAAPDSAAAADAGPVRVAMAIAPDRVHLPERKPALDASALGLRMAALEADSVPAGRSSLTALIPSPSIEDPISAALAAAPADTAAPQRNDMIAPDFGEASVSALIRGSAATRDAVVAVAAWRIENAFHAFGYPANTASRLHTSRFSGPAVRLYEPARVMSFRAG